MARPRPPLPPGLAGLTFAVAQARELGVPPHRLRPGGDVHTVTRAVRAPGPPTTLDRYAADVAVGLPLPFAFSHLTAARLWRLPVPHPWRPGEPLHVTRPTAGAQVRRPEVVGHRGLESRTVVLLRGVPVTGPAWTWSDLSALPGFGVDDLVVAGDAFVARDASLLEELRDVSMVPGGRRGARALRTAVELVRVGSGSPMETRARLVFARAGLPEPELNATVLAVEDGQFLARVDFLWREARVVVEYEGDHHRTDRRQWQQDIARTRLLEAQGWTVVRITAADLADARLRRELVALLSRLLG